MRSSQFRWTAVTVVGVIAVASLTWTQPWRRPEAVRSAGVDPAGNVRLVGRGRFVVAVPHRWATGDVQCGTPMSDTVMFWAEVVNLCAIEQPTPHSTVEILPFKRTEPHAKIRASAHRLPRGWTTVPAVWSGDGCGPWPRSYPAGYEITFRKQCLQRAGLKPEITVSEHLPSPSSLAVSPREGSAVRRGSFVKLIQPTPEVG